MRLNVCTCTLTAEKCLQDGIQKTGVPKVAEARESIVWTMIGAVKDRAVVLYICWYEGPQSGMVSKSVVLSALGRKSLQMQDAIITLADVMPIWKEITVYRFQILG